MKLLKLDIPYFDNKTGFIRPGTYLIEDTIKIVELRRESNGKITPLYLPTYKKGQTISLKLKKDIVGHRVLFYGKLFNEENYLLIKKFFKSTPNKTELLEFIPTHLKELEEVFKNKEDLNYYLMQLAFDFNKLPREFEMLYKGKIINEFSPLKEEWNNNKKSFELLTYIK